MKTVAIVQARMGSSRLPGKVMKQVEGLPMIEVLLKRLSRAKNLDQIVVATSIDPRNEPFVEYVKVMGFECVQGSENDVLERYLQAAVHCEADVVVRITGDCPLVDPHLVDIVVQGFKQAHVDYYTNCAPPTFPDGLDIEVFTFEALKKSAQMTQSKHDHEHVTPYLRESGEFKTATFKNDVDLSAWRWTVDEASDLEVIRRVFSHFSPNLYFGWEEVVALRQSMPQIF